VAFAFSSVRCPDTIMVAARQPVFEAVKPVLEAMGDKVYYVGEQPGQGVTVKTVNQLLCGVHIDVVAEAFALAAVAHQLFLATLDAARVLPTTVR
jgi:3-hydroxyisobutyrate dehydrogenase-like beta-hydroxyacid dehydrogenase